jgi:hypothetical protein
MVVLTYDAVLGAWPREVKSQRRGRQGSGRGGRLVENQILPHQPFSNAIRQHSKQGKVSLITMINIVFDATDPTNRKIERAFGFLDFWICQFLLSSPIIPSI